MLFADALGLPLAQLWCYQPWPPPGLPLPVPLLSLGGQEENCTPWSLGLKVVVARGDARLDMGGLCLLDPSWEEKGGLDPSEPLPPGWNCVQAGADR